LTAAFAVLPGLPRCRKTQYRPQRVVPMSSASQASRRDRG
jgi:hypothetical protein